MRAKAARIPRIVCHVRSPDPNSNHMGHRRTNRVSIKWIAGRRSRLWSRRAEAAPGGSIKDIDDPHTVTAVGLRSYCSLGVGDLPAPRVAAEIPPARASVRPAPWRPKLIEHRSEEQEKGRN
jgi:hypothetical protein